MVRLFFLKKDSIDLFFILIAANLFTNIFL